MAWNDRDRLAPRFRIVCDVGWDELLPSEEPGVRLCSRCEHQVFEAVDEASFERHARAGRCVFVDTADAGALLARPEGPPRPPPVAGAPPLPRDRIDRIPPLPLPEPGQLPGPTTDGDPPAPVDDPGLGSLDPNR